MRFTDRDGLRRPKHISNVARALGVTAVLFVVLPVSISWETPPQKLPESAPLSNLTWQPALDYDTDGCYPTPAIGPDGTLNPGVKNGGTLNGECRSESDLDNTNAYSRSKCNHGWCAYMYGLYFEKDTATAGVDCCGHRHDLEHIVIWVNNNRVQYVSVSTHTTYQTYDRSKIAFEGTHAKVVYHKDGRTTHCFRKASFNEEPENHDGTWQYPSLVGWNNFPPGIRDKLTQADFGTAVLALKDGLFEQNLAKAMPSGIAFDPNA